MHAYRTLLLRTSLVLLSVAATAASGWSRAGADRHARADVHETAAVPGPLPFFYDLYTFRGGQGGTAIVSAYAVEAGRLETEVADGHSRYRFSVSLVLADTMLGSVSNTHDTVYVTVPGPMDDEHLLYTHVEVAAPPSATTLHRVLMNDATVPGMGQLYSEYFPIPDYSGAGLMLSDIALGQPDAEAGWRRGDVTLALLPTSLFPSSAFDVYYEIYNMPAGTPYSTRITIEHDEGAGEDVAGGREPISRLRFDGKAAPEGEHGLVELRRVDTSLPRGRYRITVTVTDLSTSASASRSRAFHVRGWQRGTTMVPALPERAARH